jgi:hypothetical protein
MVVVCWFKGKGRKLFFFEKKNQKTSVTLAVAWVDAVAPSAVPVKKVFLLLFVHKKKRLLTSRDTDSPSRAA